MNKVEYAVLIAQEEPRCIKEEGSTDITHGTSVTITPKDHACLPLHMNMCEAPGKTPPFTMFLKVLQRE